MVGEGHALDFSQERGLMPITIGLLIRNSTVRQIGNWRSEAQYDLGPRIEQRGCIIRYYDEQGISGADLAKRKVAMQMLDDLKAGVIQGIAAYDFKRLTRDEFGIDGGTIARIVVQAGGRFHTLDREYNLRLDDDLLQFQFQCFIAGIDWRNIRNTFWSGTFKKLEREPHYMKTPLGYMNVADEQGKKHVTKNPEHVAIIEALARLFDECDSLSEVVRRLNIHGPARPAFRGRGGESTRWHKYGLRYVLRNTIYTGTFTFGTTLKQRSTVWDRFALDPETNQPKTFLRHCPELAYWETARVRRWRRKFDKPELSRTMKGGQRHALGGVLECVSCGSRMIGHGPGTYACSAVGSGKGRGGVPCGEPQMLTESVVLQMLRQELPRAFADVQNLAERAREQLLIRKPSAAAQQLAFLEDRARSIAEVMFNETIPESALPTMLARLRETEAKTAELRIKIADEEDERQGDEELARTVEVLTSRPLDVIDRLSIADRGRVYAKLFSRVRIEVRGFAAGRQWRLAAYTARWIDHPRITDDAPWAHYPNPKTKLREGIGRGQLVFDERTVTNLGNGNIAPAYADYVGSLRELAAALAGSA